ncbi:cell envelope integrity protein TolA [Trinickia caryophylli]|uniref:cell envelope integrity protein TolA n=1 Tax=Trinickia caryophylli TaxID=28094 RepID=UPI000C887CB5|nr:cell envelope integrity protein TolA [Trinickia caryophylli]PMS12599.1 cell envelope integrity protein TolA [Trinickia caryophylli]
MNRKKSDVYPLQPPRERGTGRAFSLALVMHVLLGVFLYHGIHWQNSTPAPPVQDEEADIALQEKKRQQQEAAQRAAQLAEQQRQQRLQAEQEAEAKRQRQLAEQQAELAAQKAAAEKLKRQQAEKLRQQQLAEQRQEQLKQQKEDELKQQQLDAQKKAEADKAAKAKALAQQQAKQKQQLDQERRARLAQLQGLAGDSPTGNGLAKGGTGTGSGGTAASAGYADKVKRRVRPNIVWAGETQGLETVIAVRCSPTGTLLSATIQRGSGNAQWDDAALRAVQRSDPMPLDDNGRAPASFTITMRPAG